jgi:hypothetical protein
MKLPENREAQIEFIENQLSVNPVIVIKWIGEGTKEDRKVSIKQKCVVQPGINPRNKKIQGAITKTATEKLSLDRDEYFEEGDDFTLVDNAELDTSSKYGQTTWSWLKHSPYLALRKEEASMGVNQPHFYVYIESVEATKSITKISDKLKALQLVDSSSQDDLYLMTRAMGEDRSGQNPIVLREYLLGLADSNPAFIIGLYTSSTTVAKLALFSYEDNNIVRVDKNGVYYYKEEMLGEFNTAVEYIAKNNKPSVIQAMKKQLIDVKSKEISQAEKQK